MNRLIKTLLTKFSDEQRRLIYLDDVKNNELNNFKKLFIDFKNTARNHIQRFKLDYEDIFPCLNDNTGITTFDTHYIYHPAWAARVLQKIKPEFHVDISSTLHFCSIVSAFLPVRFYDYRPAKLNLSNLTSEAADLTALHFPDNSISSLSCMHTIEHIGLGRYGDPIDYDGDLKAADELKRVVKTGGDLLIVLPVGKPKIMFNAHRIYEYSQVIEMFREFKLIEFVLIPDDAINIGIIQNATKAQSDMQNYGCGCFWFKKEQS